MTSMNNILVTADGVCDLPKDVLNRLGVETIPFRIVTPHGRFLDGVEVDSEGLSQYFSDEKEGAVPEAPGMEDYMDFFSGLSTPGQEILHISLADPEYGACANALKAAEALEEKNIRVAVVNSGLVSSGLGLMVMAACALVRQGASSGEIQTGLCDFRKQVASSFVLSDLSRQVFTGNRSGKETFYSRLLLRPLFTLRNGRIRADGLWFGRASTVIKKYVRSCLRNAARIDPEVLFIAHSGLPPEKLDFIRSEVQRYVDFRRIFVVETSAAVLCGCGPGAFGLFYVKKGKTGISPGDILNS